MQVLLDINDNKAEHFLEMLKNFSFVKVKEVGPGEKHRKIRNEQSPKLPHITYRKIILSILNGDLSKEFSSDEVLVACKIHPETAKRFFNKHKKGNGKTSELFEQTGNKYKLIYPLKYGFQLLADIKSTTDEINQAIEGKVKLQTAEEFLNEL